MLSDSDEPPRPAPIFKAKRKRTGKRRVREAALSEEEENGAFSESASAPGIGHGSSSLSVKSEVPSEPSRVARWARLSALSGNKNNEDIESKTGLRTETERYGHVTPEPLENKAYTRIDLPKPAAATATFSLRESYFRDAPLETLSLDKEYADGYGNVSDEDEKRVARTLTVSEDEGPELVGHDIMGPARDLGGMYDMELSMDEDAVESEKVSEIPDQEIVLTRLMEKVAALSLEISLKEQKSASLKQDLAQLQAEKQDVVAGL